MVKVRKFRILAWSMFLRMFALFTSFVTVSIFYYKVMCWWSSVSGLRQFEDARMRHILLTGNDYGDGNGKGHTFLPILMPSCNRLDYVARILESLVHVSDIENAILVISEDCGFKAIQELLSTQDLPFPVILLYHERPFFSILSFLTGSNEYAISYNVYFLLKFAFEHLKSSGAIVLESDLEPSKDFYRYFQWTFKHFMDPRTEMETPWKGQTLCINGYGDHSIEGHLDLDPYALYPYIFVVSGWMTSRARWDQYFRDNWTPVGGWDHWIQNRIRKPHNLVCMSPYLSRIKNIGAKGEHFSLSEEEFEATDFGKIVIDRVTDRNFEGVIPQVSNQTFHI